MADEKEAKGFTINDKRRFETDGESRTDTGEATAGSNGSAGEAASARQQEAARTAYEGGTCVSGEKALPDIDFGTFMISLSSSAFIHLGLLPNPLNKTKEVNLPAAKQTIDIVSMLQKKTVNNLSREEEDLLSRILFDLQMTFVQVCNKASGAKEK